MNYKIEGAIRRNRKNFIIFAILWVFIAIVFVAPVIHTYYIANTGGNFDLQIFIENVGNSFMHPFQSFGSVLTEGSISSYFSMLLVVSIFYALFFFVGFVKSAPKNEFTDIEHGSSDWSQRGEQYQILSRNKGIILAEDNYLPVDKRGNVNVLVVGRIRFW